jgi:type I restriction-modification system DNA methylase subunit
MEYTNILTKDYNTSNLQSLLLDIFGKNLKVFTNSKNFPGDNKIVQKQMQLGEIALDDGNTLAVYEIELRSNIHISHNRVMIRNLLRKQWSLYDGAFIVAYQPDNHDWRFSFVSETRQWNMDGTKYEKAVTDPKRYTYLFGENETARTANERFMQLKKQENARLSLSNVIDTFSVEKLSKAFFNEYEQYYKRFCSHLLGNDSYRRAFFKGDDKFIRDFCKKLLGRIVFLYFLQKKGWLGASDLNYIDGDKNFLVKLFKESGCSDSFYSQWLAKLFFDTLNKKRDRDDFMMPDGTIVKIPFLNGGLFEDDFHYETHQQAANKKKRFPFSDVTRLVDFPKDLFIDMFAFFDKYNFTIYEDDPNDHTVAVDPEMLGRIFENLLEDNKNKGEYYTPKEIVHYMCRESLKAYCLNYEPCDTFTYDDYKEIVEILFSNDEIKLDQTREIDIILQTINEKLDKVKICDPAIGSGAFPMGLLHEIFTVKQTIALLAEREFSPSATKLNVIQNSIYGVDIERGAVDIARLRFWLSLIIDEDVPKPLPNLDYKIVVGNSLVSEFEGEVITIDWGTDKNDAFQTNIFGSAELRININKQLLLIGEKQKVYFNPRSNKKQLALEIRNLKIDLLIDLLELMIRTRGKETNPDRVINVTLEKDMYFQTLIWKNYVCKLQRLKNNPNEPLNFFDWRLDFPEVMNPMLVEVEGGCSDIKMGYDIVVGNPPYVSAPTMMATNPQGRKAIVASKRFITLFQKWDLYVPFMEFGLQLLNPKGIFAMIVPYPFTNQTYAKKLRELIVNQYNLVEIVDLNGRKIFPNATVSNCIPFISKNNKGQSCLVSVMNENKQIIPSFHQQFSNLIQDKSKAVWNLTVVKRDSHRHDSMNVLGDFCYISVGMVINSNEKTAKGEFEKDDLISEFRDEIHCREYIEAKDIERYRINKIRYLEYNTERCPNKLRRPTFRELYDPQKLLINCLGTINVAIDENRKILHNHSLSCAILWKDLKRVENKSISISVKRYSRFTRQKMEILSTHMDLRFLLGLLNSRYARVLLSNFRGGGNSIYPEHIRNLPIPLVPKEQQQPIITSVSQILELKKHNVDTSVLEMEIDTMVYSLYGLDDDEIKIAKQK